MHTTGGHTATEDTEAEVHTHTHRKNARTPSVDLHLYFFPVAMYLFSYLFVGGLPVR